MRFHDSRLGDAVVPIIRDRSDTQTLQASRLQSTCDNQTCEAHEHPTLKFRSGFVVVSDSPGRCSGYLQIYRGATSPHVAIEPPVHSYRTTKHETRAGNETGNARPFRRSSSSSSSSSSSEASPMVGAFGPGLLVPDWGVVSELAVGSAARMAAGTLP